MVLGIEEYLDGPLLSYINELGYVAFGFEAGQHDTKESIINHQSFIMLTIMLTGNIIGGQKLFEKHFKQLDQLSQGLRKVFEIYYRYKIQEGENFVMKPGFENFMKVEKNTLLAESNGKKIFATHKGSILMPLYQGLGDDGFFAIRPIPKFFLNLSVILRKVRFDQFLRLLPGVSRPIGPKNMLLVNLKIARFFTKDFFHLLGYRSKKINGHHLLMKNRERYARTSDYRSAKWY